MALRYVLLSSVGFLVCFGLTYAAIWQNGLEPTDDRIWPFLAIAALVGLYAPARIYQIWRFARRRMRDGGQPKTELQRRMEERRARVAAARAKAAPREP